MLFDLAAWVVILLVAWTVGRGVLALLRVDGLRPGDAFAIAAWIGVVVLTLALLGASIAGPLTPVTASVVAAILMALGITVTARARRRAEILETPGPLPHRQLWILGSLGAGAIAIGAAALTSDAVTLYDSLVYHIGIMRWLREHGTVAGMALVHNRLGHVSAWFTLAAPFDHGAAADRMATIPLGVALVLVGGQSAIAAGRIAARRAWVADWFFVTLAVALVWAVVTRGAATPSPDVATNVLIAVAAWSLLVVCQQTRLDPSVRLATGHALLPLILALGAAAMKLFALPIALVAAVFFLVSTRATESTRSLVKATAIVGGIALLCLGPFVAANVAASGCPLYPSAIGCTRLSWSVGPTAAADYAEYIRDVARWDRRGNIPPNDPVGWVVPWLGAHPIVTVLAVLSPVIGAVLLRHARRDRTRSGRQPALLAAQTVVALGLAGIGFALWQAPAPRFLYAVVLLIPSLAVAYWLHAASASPAPAERTALVSNRFAAGFAAAGAIIGLAYAIASQKLNVRSALVHGTPLIHLRRGDLLMPEAPQAQSRLFRWRVNDVDVLTPVPLPVADTLGYQSVIAHNAEFEKCSTAPLPCTPYLPGPEVRLRRPAIGLAGGFVRLTETDLSASAATCVGELTSRTSIRPASVGEGTGSDASRCRPSDDR